MAYGYPHIKGDEGYPIDVYIGDYLNENIVNDGDVTLVVDSKIRMDSFTGMSGSPVFYRNKVIGILIEQTIESIGNNQKAKWYTNDNIDQMLMERHLNKKARRSSHKNHIKGPKKRTEEDDERFTQSFEKMIKMAQESEM